MQNNLKYYTKKSKIFNDDRGYLTEIFNSKNLNSFKCEHVNFVFSKKYSLRGLHFQKYPHSQAKLLRVLDGIIFDVIIDIRKSSKNFGHKYFFKLKHDERNTIYIPKDYAHGFLTLSKTSTVCYCMDYKRVQNSEVSLRWDDPVLNIKWPVNREKIIVSDKDKKGYLFSNYFL